MAHFAMSWFRKRWFVRSSGRHNTQANRIRPTLETLEGRVTPNAAPINLMGGSIGMTSEEGAPVELANISTFLAGKATDADGDPIGMAVTGASPGWEFYQGQWWDFRRPGDLSATNALLIPAGTKIRYNPPKDFNGIATINYKAWDQTSGNALSSVGTNTSTGTAFSQATKQAKVGVSPVNDAPQVVSNNLVARFDGGDDFIDLGAATFGGEITVETWAYVDNPYRPWIRFAEFAGPNFNASNNIALGMESTSGRLFYGVSQSDTGANNMNYTAGQVVPAQQWFHVALSHSASTVKLFINGVKVLDQGSAFLPPDVERSHVYIARSNYPQDAYFGGDMREFKVWGRALSEGEIKNSYDGQVLTGDEPDLLAYYPLNGTAENYSNNAEAFPNGTPMNGASFAPERGGPRSAFGFEDARSISLAGMAVKDVDATSVRITLSVPSGVGVLRAGKTAGVAISGAGTTQLTLSGPINSVNKALGTLTLAAPANYFGSFDLSHTVSDLGGTGAGGVLIASGNRKVVIAPLNDLPVITNKPPAGNLVVADGTTAVRQFLATDIEDGTDLVFSIIGGADQSQFTIDSTTGELKFSPTAVFANPQDAGADNLYDVQLKVEDKDGGTDVVNLTVQVVDGVSMAFTDQPRTARSGVASTYVVQVLDGEGKPAKGFNGPVTVSVASGPAGGVLSGSRTVNAVNGVATFSALSMNRSGVYTLRATGGAFSATSAPITVSPHRLVISSMPVAVTGGGYFSVVVRAVDIDGVLATRFQGPVTVRGHGNQIAGVTTVKAVNGVAVFRYLTVPQLGKLRLSAHSPAISSLSPMNPLALSPDVPLVGMSDGWIMVASYGRRQPIPARK